MKDAPVRDIATLKEELIAILGEDRISTSHAVREQHGKDESYHEPQLPDVVVFAHTTDEISAIAKVCTARKIPMVPYGAGTSLEGHLCATQGGVSIDVSQMDQIICVNAEDMDVSVQPGVRRKQLNEYLRDTGLFFPIDPGADASIGGMASTRASGTNAVRYGTMRENVISLTVVMADGKIIRTARRARKSASGYDLTHLFVGAEGTLGIITEITLKLHGIPQHAAAAVCPFPTIKGAIDTVITTIQCAVPIARIEILDEAQMAATNAYSKTDYPVQPTLLLEFHGTEASVAEQVELVKEIASDNGASDFEWATRPEDRDRLWEARHNAYYAALAVRPGCGGMVTDICVPISRLTEAVLETQNDLNSTDIPSCIVGHVGDGNLHTMLMIDPDSKAEHEEAEKINERMVMRSIGMDGTATGEHGVGLGKMKYMEAEHGPALDVMRMIKAALDPDNLMNPGKIF